MPGGGETGWSYVIDISKKVYGKNLLDLPYKFVMYDLDGRILGKDEIVVRCVFPVISDSNGVEKINAICMPVFLSIQRKDFLITIIIFIIGVASFLFNFTNIGNFILHKLN